VESQRELCGRYSQVESFLVAIGGLSTGGALSFYTAVKNPAITGTVYLFSAALDLVGGPGGVAGEAAERILRIPIHIRGQYHRSL
jgi:hypothetical protein